MDIDDKIEQLEDAIASGARKIVTRSNGVHTEIEYQSTSQMETALARLKARRSGKSRIILAAL